MDFQELSFLNPYFGMNLSQPGLGTMDQFPPSPASQNNEHVSFFDDDNPSTCNGCSSLADTIADLSNVLLHHYASNSNKSSIKPLQSAVRNLTKCLLHAHNLNEDSADHLVEEKASNEENDPVGDAPPPADDAMNLSLTLRMNATEDHSRQREAVPVGPSDRESKVEDVAPDAVTERLWILKSRDALLRDITSGDSALENYPRTFPAGININPLHDMSRPLYPDVRDSPFREPGETAGIGNNPILDGHFETLPPPIQFNELHRLLYSGTRTQEGEETTLSHAETKTPEDKKTKPVHIEKPPLTVTDGASREATPSGRSDLTESESDESTWERL